MPLEHKIICKITEIERIPRITQGNGHELVLVFEGELRRNTKDWIEQAIKRENITIVQNKKLIG